MDVCGSKIDANLVSYRPHEKAMLSAEIMSDDVNLSASSNVIDSYMTNFFKDCPDDMQETTLLKDALKPQRIFIKCLGFDIYVFISVFQKNVAIHIRKLVTNDSGELIPTRQGITFHLKTWYAFLKHIYNFTLRYRESSFVCGNSVVVLSCGDTMLIKDIRLSRCIVLNDCHLTILKETLPDLNDKLLTFLYEQYLPGLISELCVPDPVNKDDELMDEVRLCSHLENHLSIAMQEAFYCYGCSINASAQKSHECIMRSELEKYQHLGSSVFLLMNYNILAKDFVTENSNITLEFLLNMNFNRISDVMYKTL